MIRMQQLLPQLTLNVEKGTIPVTDKEGHDHGFGLATIQEAAQRLDGEMLCYTENGNFVLVCDDIMSSFLRKELRKNGTTV